MVMVMVTLQWSVSTFHQKQMNNFLAGPLWQQIVHRIVRRFVSKIARVDGPLHVLRGPVPEDAGTALLLILQIFNLSIISIAVLEDVSSTQGFRKEPPFPHYL
jgi:hypothetical protein